MSRLTIVLLAVLLFPTLSFGPADQYREAFGDAYANALNFCEEEKNTFQKFAQEHDLDPNFMQAIVFPELMRFDAFRDFFETEALELAYLKGGTKLADFSIGHFQMKPSFAEFMEKRANEDREVEWGINFQGLCSFSAGGEKERRKERLERLKDKKWQMIYLSAFIKYAEISLDPSLSKEIQLQLIATRYNCGPQKDWPEVKKWLAKKTFPYGPAYEKSSQFNYSQIALDYYNIIPSY